MQTVSDVHNDTAARQRFTAHAVATHKTLKPEIPGDYGCAGTCSQPPPSVPAGSRLQKKTVPEFFATATPQSTSYYTVVLVAALVAYVGLTTIKWR